MPALLIALFLVAHGIVHPILAMVPSRDEAAVAGGLWTNSWLLGDGPTTKQLIWIGATATCVLFVLAGLSLMGWIIPHDWSRALVIASASSSLLVLGVFWFTEFIIGVVIDAVLLLLVFVVNWTPFAIT